MNTQIRRLGIALLVCFTVLFAQLNRLTVFEAGDLNDDPGNTREIVRDFSRPRGTITSADGVVLARSVPSNDRFELQREYPEGDLFAHAVGYFSFNLGATGVEKERNGDLSGQTLDLQLESLSDLFVDKDHVGNVTLTLRKDLQQIAKDQLGGREGSVVAIDPRTGALLALWSFPSYDPNALASHDTAAATAVKTVLDASADKPLLDKTYRERFFPGSTFKVVTASAGLTSGKVTPDQPVYPTASEYLPRGTTRPLRNFGGSTCGGTLFSIIQVSCNTAFAQMGVETGPEQMVATAESFGFNRDVPIDLPDPAKSNFPTDFAQNVPALAQSAIGQNDVAATPLQMALVAAAIANRGTVMQPHVLAEVRDNDGEVIDTYDPEAWQVAVDERVAEVMRQAMLGVVNGPQGTAGRLKVPGAEVGGKTGTAQLGTDPPRSHAWIIGFAGPPGDVPHIAVAVIVEGQEGASEQTGGRVAAPIAQAILKAALDAGI
jgi:peptidoglycan glycosyltransferase